MRNRGGVRQIKEDVSSNHIFRGRKINAWAARRGGEWSKECVESG